MKKEMDIRLYKYEIIKGKEETAEEWLNFLNVNRKAGEALLKDEHAYLEAYFKTMEGGTLYVYMFFACEDVNFSNDKAINQGSGLDEQHFAYMRECIDLSSILVICQEFLKKILIYFSGKRVTLIDLRRKIQRRTSVLVDI